jgi:hypothetical protein
MVGPLGGAHREQSWESVDEHQLFREDVALLLQRLSNDFELLQVANYEEVFALCEGSSQIGP